VFISLELSLSSCQSFGLFDQSSGFCFGFLSCILSCWSLSFNSTLSLNVLAKKTGNCKNLHRDLSAIHAISGVFTTKFAFTTLSEASLIDFQTISIVLS